MKRRLDWLREAAAKMSTAAGLVGQGSYPWACFTAQQSAERSPKARLIQFGLIWRVGTLAGRSRFGCTTRWPCVSALAAEVDAGRGSVRKPRLQAEAFGERSSTRGTAPDREGKRSALASSGCGSVPFDAT